LIFLFLILVVYFIWPNIPILFQEIIIQIIYILFLTKSMKSFMYFTLTRSVGISHTFQVLIAPYDLDDLTDSHLKEQMLSISNKTIISVMRIYSQNDTKLIFIKIPKWFKWCNFHQNKHSFYILSHPASICNYNP
jgi:hypothetical protein